MKYTTTTLVTALMACTLFSSFTPKENATQDLYSIKINTLMGEPLDLNAYKGKKILFVNVASKCGFTPQYADLEKLSEKYKDQLVVIGLPCNQFGNQEPGGKETIAAFCEKNYGVTFLMTEKIDVKGEHQHPLYTWLTESSKNGVKNSEVKWNFQKYLVDEEGTWITYFSSDTTPLDPKIIKEI